jgi:hypothetical protein
MDVVLYQMQYQAAGIFFSLLAGAPEQAHFSQADTCAHQRAFLWGSDFFGIH